MFVRQEQRVKLDCLWSIRRRTVDLHRNLSREFGANQHGAVLADASSVAEVLCKCSVFLGCVLVTVFGLEYGATD